MPDASGVLALSTNLLYDDAPWLTKKVKCSTHCYARVALLCVRCGVVLCYDMLCRASRRFAIHLFEHQL